MVTSLIPESAPFTTEQRAWLNGFLAGMMGLQENGQAARFSFPEASSQNADVPSTASESQEEFPWHDPSLPILDRMKLAAEKPLERKLMAAMAQLDCGACGYVCQTYSEAIARGDEKNLTLCSPGGAETTKLLKKLVKEQGSAPATNVNGTHKANGSEVHVKGTAKHVWSRANPYAAKLVSVNNLNRAGSSKHTSHVVIDLGDSGVSYIPGDALGVYPTNCPDLVDAVIGSIGAKGHEPVRSDDGRKATLRSTLMESRCLRGWDEELWELLIDSLPPAERTSPNATLSDDEEVEGWDVLDLLERINVQRVDPQRFIECLRPLNPRLYSIASSQRIVGNQVHLTVGRVQTELRGRIRKGVASTMFADRCSGDFRVKVFVHKAHGFGVPVDSAAPMIMVGPGTGIAPFRAFLQERAALKSSGPNWLFFGDQRGEFDFLYRDELEAWQRNGLLTRLDTAFSRDQDRKIYVQDRMRQHGAELFQWLERGGHFFVCGDASRMAHDVDKALRDVIREHGRLDSSGADAYVAGLKEQQRYQRDVY